MAQNLHLPGADDEQRLGRFPLQKDVVIPLILALAKEVNYLLPIPLRQAGEKR
jgi:hypothetical protein